MNEQFDYAFHIAAAIFLWVAYLSMRTILRYLSEYKMMRAERDWALAQLSEQGLQIPYHDVHSDKAA